MFYAHLLIRDGSSLIFIDFVARKIVSVRFCKTDYCFFEYYVEKYWIFFHILRKNVYFCDIESVSYKELG